MAPVVYMLGTLVTLACGIFLLRGYSEDESGFCSGAVSASSLLRYRICSFLWIW